MNFLNSWQPYALIWNNNTKNYTTLQCIWYKEVNFLPNHRNFKCVFTLELTRVITFQEDWLQSWFDHVEILSKSDIFFFLSSCTFCHLGWERGAVDKAPLRRAITSTPALLPKPIWTIQSGIVLWFPEWTSSFHLSGSVTKVCCCMWLYDC